MTELIVAIRKIGSINEGLRDYKKSETDDQKKTLRVYSRPKRNAKKPDLYSNSEWVLKDIIKE